MTDDTMTEEECDQEFRFWWRSFSPIQREWLYRYSLTQREREMIDFTTGELKEES